MTDDIKKAISGNGVKHYRLKQSGITIKKESRRPYAVISAVCFIVTYVTLCVIYKKQYNPLILLLPSGFVSIGLMLFVYGIYYTATHRNLKLDLDFPKEKVNGAVIKTNKEMISEESRSETLHYQEFSYFFDCRYDGVHYVFERVIRNHDRINGKKPKINDTWVILFDTRDPEYSLLEEDFKAEKKKIKNDGFILMIFGLFWLGLIIAALVLKK